MSTSGWDPHTYHLFASERLRPALDLLAPLRMLTPRRIVDLGCGGGEATQLLVAAWPNAEFEGIDSSPTMLAAARERLPNVRWTEASLQTWMPAAPVDLFFANASLHWLDNHAALFERLMAGLVPGGVLAVQMPRNFNEPSHRTIAEIVRDDRWRDTLAPAVRPTPVLSPEGYIALLSPLASAIDVWETVYYHRLRGENPVLDWVMGSALRPFLARLSETEQKQFIDACGKWLAAAYPAEPDGMTTFPFRRTFIVARR